METLFAPGRRSLPPVPVPSVSRSTAGAAADAMHLDDSTAVSSAVSDGLDVIAQGFVNRVRSAAADFAAAAGAESAMVCEAVPPARHRRSRCRLVLKYADGSERDLTFLGAAGTPTRSRLSFDRHIQGWLRDGQQHEPAWLVADVDAAGGLAIDVPAWLATAAPTSR